MKRILCRILISGLSITMSQAQLQPAPLRLTLDSLQKHADIGYPLRYPMWQFHPGHNARWASPTVDDHTWTPFRSWFTPPQVPPGWNGVGWFRLRFTVDSSLVGPILAMRLVHRSASEIYLDGQKIGSFGTIGHTPATNRDVFPFSEPLAFRFARPGQHVLAVRLSSQHAPYVSRHLWTTQGFILQIGSHKTLTKLVVSLTRLDALQLALALATGLFALLHLILFIGYPGRLSNLYYSGWLVLSSLDFVCAYVDFSVHDPAWQQTATRLDLAVNFALAVISVAFIYSVYYGRQPRRIGVFCALALLITAFLLLNPSVMPYNLFFGFLLGCMLEVVRIVFLALRRGLPGVWLIGVGVLVAALVLYAGPANQFGLWNTGDTDSLYQQALFTTIGYLVLPLCTSIYLAQDVARTNRDLAAQLEQVRDLSAKTLAQETEKRDLVARQNEQLERTVQERTGQLQQQTDKLREMDRVKSRFFTNLTHEFRTPLTLMLGPAEQVLAHTQEPTTKQHVGLLQLNAQRLLRLINQLLELSKLEAGKSELTLAPGDWVGLVRGTLHSFEALARQKGIVLQLTSVRAHLMMGMDRPKLETILYNLFANALQFTPTDGKVSVELIDWTENNGAWVELRVADTGLGIAGEKLPYVFDRFYQADASDTRQQEGTGIGLALTKELVELHGGSIQLASQEGVGTTAIVRLPRRQEPPFGPVGSATDRPATGLSHPELVAMTGPSPAGTAPVDLRPHPLRQGAPETPLVLLIEDNEEVRHFIRSSLGRYAGADIPLDGIPLGSEERGDTYRILEAGNGEEGVRMAQQTIPDLVITDLMMPRMDGYQVCTTLKQDERTSHIPIIMLTARADLESKLEGLQTGADSYLAKPFHQRELLAHLTNLLRVRQQLRDYYSQATLEPKSIRTRGDWLPNDLALPSMEQVFLDRIRTALETHLDDEHYNVDQLCQEVGLGRTQLYRKLKALVNQTPGDWLRILRLQLAHDLLQGHVGTVAEVAYRVGFGNPANFSTSFSRHFGYAPSEVRKKMDF